MRLALCAILLTACATNDTRGRTNGNGDGGAGNPDLSAGGGDGGGTMNCAPDSPDLTGCNCGGSAMRACYPSSADPSTRNVGACKDGSQTCMSSGEFGAWGSCSGAITPVQESCTNGVDDDCNGKVDCADPSCATDPACNTGCTDGQTRPCYDGPSQTENVGTCKDGTQTCSGGQWPSNCPGEVLPTSENCSDNQDHNCDHLPGCFDFSCFVSPACQTQCQMPLDAGCVCPMGSGDQMTCPDGMHDVHKGTFPGTDECCPCGAGDCNDINCCGNDVCNGAAACQGLTCTPLPASCNGQVSADCDEPCCKCTMCP